MVARIRGMLIVLAASLGIGGAVAVSPAAASTHSQRQVVAQQQAYNRCMQYQGCTALRLVGATYGVTTASSFHYEYRTRYCGTKGYYLVVNNNLSVSSRTSYGGHC